MAKFATSLSRNSSTANVGNLMGNRMFYANDYMVRMINFSRTRSNNLIVGSPRSELCFDAQDVFVENNKY